MLLHYIIKNTTRYNKHLKAHRGQRFTNGRDNHWGSSRRSPETSQAFRIEEKLDCSYSFIF